MGFIKFAFFILAVICLTESDAKLVKLKSGETACFCTLDYNPVCASNGITYGNSCDFECARDEAVALGRSEITLRNTGECFL